MDRIKRNRILVCLCIFGVILFVVAGIVVYLMFFMKDPLTPAERAKIILAKAPLIDGKNDFPYNIRKFASNDLRTFNFSNISSTLPWRNLRYSQTDFFRMKKGKVGTQVWVVRAECESQYKDAVAITMEQIDLMKRLVANYSSVLMLVNKTKHIEKAEKANKIGSLISIEGGHSIQSSLGILRTYYSLGVRMMTLAKGCSTPWVDYSKVDHSNKLARALPYNQGLLPKFGEDVIAEMNRLGMIIDLSHTSTSAMEDILKKSKAPVVFSHAAARNICDSEHNLPDKILKLLRQNNGLVMITFDSRLITCGSSNSTVHHVIEHINYIKSRTSVDNVGIGSNFDGMDRPVKGLEDVSKFPNLFAALIESGWDYGDLEKLAGRNFLRVFGEVEKVRDSLKDMDPIQTHIDRQHVKDHWDKENCTSRMGLFPLDYSSSYSNYSLPRELLSILG